MTAPARHTDPAAAGPALSESSKKRIRDHLRGALEAPGIIDIPALARAAQAWAVQEPRLKSQLLDEVLYPVVYDLTHEMVSRSRASLHLVEVPSGGAAISQAALDAGAAAIETKFVGSKWLRWCETLRHGHTLPLGKMRPVDLRDAAAIRRDRARRDDHLSRLWEALAEGLKDDGSQTVEDKWTDEQIEQLSQELQAPAPPRKTTTRTRGGN